MSDHFTDTVMDAMEGVEVWVGWGDGVGDDDGSYGTLDRDSRRDLAKRVTAALLADPAAHAAMLDALVEVGVLRERVTRTHHVASAFDADGQSVSFAMTGRDAYALRELIAARKYGFHPATHRVVTAVRREWYAEGSPDVEWEVLP